ncbi:hypothetical protein HG530_014003 [Fusarium avenaceum]|nr:hypothetical protein HG530_014003 [Fusarium avenaceum]
MRTTACNLVGEVKANIRESCAQRYLGTIAFLRKVSAALPSKFCKHISLSVLACAPTHKQPPRKIFLVKGLESIFALDETEQLKRLVELPVELGILVTCASLSLFFCCRSILHIRQKLLWQCLQTAPQEHVDVFGDHLANLGCTCFPTFGNFTIVHKLPK